MSMEIPDDRAQAEAEAEAFRTQSTLIPGAVGALLRAIAIARVDAEAKATRRQLPESEAWRWSPVVAKAEALLAELRAHPSEPKET